MSAALNGSAIAGKSAEKIATAVGKPVEKLFTVTVNRKPLAPSTVHAYHRTISSILDRAVKWGYIGRNPAERVELPPLGQHKARYLDEPDARKLLQLLQEEPIKWRAPITFDLLSGLRRGELLGLRWQDVDLDTGVIHVAQTSNYVSKKGVYTSTPKTEGSGRHLRVSRSAILILLEYREWQKNQREILGDAWQDEDNWIFTDEEGRPLFPTSLTWWLNTFIKKVDLPSVSVHSLRHTYASLLIADGAPLVVVSSNLGHSQVSTTSDIYAHVISSAEARATEVLDRFAEEINPKLTPKGKNEEIS